MHFRQRHIQPILSKRAKIFPVVGLIGPRQVGKTTFLMQEWKTKRSANYVTLDKSDIFGRARREPENFLLSESDNLTKALIIDEVQKVPALFDSIKSIIDERRRMGAFTVSGSVEFSDKAGVRESLAGRIGLCRLYPLTLCELGKQTFHAPWVKGFQNHSQNRKAKEIDMWLKRGGMPIFCALHDKSEMTLTIDGWLDAVCYRDIQQLKQGKFEGSVARLILSSIVREPQINISKIAQDAGVSRSAISKYLSALEALFLIYKLPSFSNRRSNPDYVPFDCAMIRHLLGHVDDSFSRHQTMRTLVINEILAQHEYSGERRPEILSYRTRGGAELDLVLKKKQGILGVKISIKSDITPYSIRSMKSFLSKNPSAQGIVLAPVTRRFKIDKSIEVIPWTFIG